MNFDKLIIRLKEELLNPLPGIHAQLMMSSMKRIAELLSRKPNDPIKSSVLILLYPFDEDIRFIVILRPEYDGIHSSQISLPGGKFEEQDKDLCYTALREAEEEIGIDPVQVHMLGAITELYIPPSNYLVSPFLGYTHDRPVFKADPVEVARIIEIPLTDFLNKDNITTRKIKLKPGISFRVPCWDFDGNIIWGATAMILSEFHELLLRCKN